MAVPTWIETEHEDGVTTLTMSRPPVNQFDRELLEQLLGAVEGLGPETRALVIASSVERVFAAGGDLPWMAAASIEEQLPYVALCQDTYSSFERIACPAIAAVEGHCLGGGFELCLGCDIRVAARDASFGLPEATIGLIAGAGGTQRLVRAVGQGLARDLLLTGRRISGEEAAAHGIVSRLVDRGEARATAQEIARDLAGGPTEAIEATKRLAVAASELEIEEGLARERAEWQTVRESALTQEGLEAFAEKRPPEFGALRGRA
ncbi:MAG: enoyl-CoA hydratase/isomerase family protein [Solirubrobacterales bacterium]